VIVYVSIPALIALLFKLVLIGYSLRYPRRNLVARLFLTLLIVLTLQNAVEFWLLNHYAGYGLTAAAEAGGFAYTALLILVGTVILHLSFALSFDHSPPRWHRWLVLLYLPAIVLDSLLVFTKKLVLGFKPFLSYTILRDPGPWYFLVETFAIAYLLVTLANLIYGARASCTAPFRIRNRLWLLGLAPMVAFLLSVVIVEHVGGFSLSMPFYLPIAITFFLIVTTYATHERPRAGGFYRFLYRLFDIESYFPWSQAYRRKTTLYDRIRGTIADASDLRSLGDIVDRVAHTLQCPVALFGRRQSPPVFAGAVAALTDFPHEELHNVDRLVVAHEIGDRMPRIHSFMARHRVAAIVPFHPYSRAASWMLLGEAFSEQVYTPSDFDIVKKLFDRLADQLLDEQLRMRVRLNEARRETTMLYRQLTAATERLDTLTKRVDTAQANGREQPSLAFVSAAPTVESGDIGPNNCKTLADYVADLERRLILNALETCDHNQAKAAEFLGLRPNTLHYKIRRYGLSNRK
jgi:DNA-binding protein Fis